MLVSRTSTLSGLKHTMNLDVTQEQLDRFENRRQTGEYISDIFPELTPRESEFLLSGITPQEWFEVYGEKEINCKGKSVDALIRELSELPDDLSVCLIHWNGNNYLRPVATHLLEMRHLKKTIKFINDWDFVAFISL